MSFLRALACAFVLSIGATEASAEGGWRIVQSTGDVVAGGAGFMPAAVAPNQTLPKDAWVETGAGGRVVLVRGQEAIALGPKSRVQLPTEPVNGNTQILQTLGSALYQVGKQKAPHFQVDTPYLAAVVKGTTFTVSVSEEGATVNVTEGLVQVATPDGSDSEFVQPGFSGVVTKGDLGNVAVVDTAKAPALPDTANDNGAGGSGEKSETHGKSDDAASNGKGSIITAAIGEVVLDVKAVSGGLATSPEVPGVKETGKGGGSVSDAVEDSKGAGEKPKGESDSVEDTGKAEIGGDDHGNADHEFGGKEVKAEPVEGGVEFGGEVGGTVDLGGGNGNAGGNGVGGVGGNGNGVGGGTVDPGIDLGGGKGNGVGAGNGVGNGNGNTVGNGNGGGNGNGNGNGNGGGKGGAPVI